MYKLLLTICTALLLNITNAQTFTNAIGGAIPDNGTAFTCFPIAVTGVGNINATLGLQSVCVNITHPFVSDVILFLVAPNGMYIPLSQENGDVGANYTNTCFTMSAVNPIVAGVAPFTGNFLPETPLGWFNDNINANGNWNLCILDAYAGDVGSLNNWSITFGNTPAALPIANCNGNKPASNFCQTAPLMCNTNAFCGKTTEDYSRYSWTQLSAAHCRTAIYNNSFLKFTASAATATFEVRVSNSFFGDGISMLAFEATCGSGPVTAKGCVMQFMPSAMPYTFTATGLTVGNSYFLMMDGVLGDPCDFTVKVLTGVALTSANATFAAIPPICSGATAPLLPAVSTNGVSGTWLPAMVSNTTTGSYTFTPTAGQCSTTPVMVTVTVNPSVTTIFAPIAPFCSGATAPVLPTTSTNGIIGTWLPALVNNMAGATYNFTPATGQCGTTATLSTTVTPSTTPTFAAIAPFCSGTVAPILPLTSTNGITGTWLPALVSNTASGAYIFTPAVGQCATNATINIVVNNATVPTFNPIAAFCAGETPPVLPNMSTNAITGTWMPALVNNTTSGSYTFTPTAGQCATTATINIVVNSATTVPTFTAIGPICNGGVAPLLPLTSTNGISGTWMPAIINNTASGSYNFTPNAGQCGVATAINITVVNAIAPTFTAIPAFCNGATAPLLPTTSNNGISGTWSPATISNTTSATYNFTPNAGQCGSNTTLSTTVTPNVVPTFNAIPAFCSGSVAPTLPTTSTNGISGTWMPNTISNTTSGSYNFTPNAGQCASTATIMVTVTPSVVPTFTIGSSSICSGATAPVLPTTSTNGINGTWSPLLVSNTTSGMYTFTPATGQCANAININIVVNPVVTPTFAPIAPFCVGSTAPVLSTTSTNGINGTWSPATISNTTSATYNFTPNAGQCANNTLINITVNPLTTPTFNAIPAFCSGGTAPVLVATSTNGISGTWLPAVINNMASGSYAFTPNAGQCASNTNLMVTVTPTVTPTFNAIPAFCNGTTAPVLPTNSNNGINGTWSPATVSNTTSGSYTFTPTAGQCANMLTINIVVNAAATVPTFNAIAAICMGAVAPGLPTTSNNGITGVWSPAIINNMASGAYIFTANAGQCATDVTINVTVLPNLIPTFAAIPSICVGSVAPILPTTSTNGYTGTWSPAVVSNTTPAVYTFTPNVGQCATTTTLNTTVTAPTTPIFTPLAPFCIGTTAPILLTTSINGITGSWSPAIVNNMASNSYIFTPATVQCANNAIINTLVTPIPTANIGPDVDLCEGNSITLNATNINPATTYLWQNGTVNPTLFVTTGGIYSVKVGLNGCEAADTLTVTYNLLPRLNLGADKTICPGDSIILMPNYTGIRPITYLWNNGTIDSFLVVKTTGNFSVDITNSCGTTNDAINITPGFCNMYIPSAFSPNNNGNNDVFKVKSNLPISNFRFEIYNRYGKRIFNTTDINKGWDGKINGVAQNTDTFIYYVTYKNNLNNIVSNLRGTVTLIR